MNERERDAALATRAKQLFRQQEAAIPVATRAALARARQRAIEQAGARRWMTWRPAIGAALAASLLLVVLWRGPEPAPDGLPGNALLAGDLELLLSAENWELVEDLDFFSVLGELDDELNSGHG